MAQLGFIILRYVNNERTNKYWIHCYDCIRQYYKENEILIIDDNSDYTFITDKDVYKTTVIKSEYPKRGEALPYYYYLRNKLFDIAVILHDSVFINKYIDFKVNRYRFLWDFEHDWDKIKDESNMINVFNDAELTAFHKNKKLWKGCFGGMSVITHKYLTYVNSKYDISKLFKFIVNRPRRCAFERVIACLLQKNVKEASLFGDIHEYCKWGIKFDEKDDYNHLPIIKVWTGR